MVAPFWMSLAPCSSLTLTMFGSEIRHCFEGVLVGGVWNGFFVVEGVDNCALYSPYATHTLLPPFSQCISLRCSVCSNLCTSLLHITYHVCLRGSSRTENARARTDTFTIVFSHGSGARLPRAPERGVQYNEKR